MVTGRHRLRVGARPSCCTRRREDVSLITPTSSSPPTHGDRVPSGAPMIAAIACQVALTNMTNATLPCPRPLELSAAQEEQLNRLNFWVNGVVTNIVVLLGLIGNVLTTVILSRRAMRSSTNYYLSALAVWDSVVLVCTCLLIGRGD